jgi:hypothetical protein
VEGSGRGLIQGTLTLSDFATLELDTVVNK